MLEYSRWKYVVAALILLISAFYALPNLYPKDSAVQVTANSGSAVDEALQKRVSDLLQEQKIATKSITKEEDNLLVRLNDSSVQLQTSDMLRDLLGDNYNVAQNLASTVPNWLEKIGGKPMLLGLDLQGGVHFLMQVDQDDALRRREEAFADEIRVVLRENKIVFNEVTVQGKSILVRINKPDDVRRAMNLAAADAPELQFQVLTPGQGSGFRATIPAATLQAITDSALEQNVTILRNRIAQISDLIEPIITRQGNDRIVVQLPGIQDTAEARNWLGATATLEWRAVIGTESDAAQAANGGRVPPEARLYYRRAEGGVAGAKGAPVLLSKRLIASGEQLIKATPQPDPQSGLPAVSVELNAAAGNRMFDFTRDNVGKLMAVVYVERRLKTVEVDGVKKTVPEVSEEVISVATIQGVFSRNFQTTGLEAKEATRLSDMLNAGSLAAPMDVIEERVIGPSLGAENIQRGLNAVLFSFLFVLAFFVVYYKVFGVITNIALLLNLLLVVAVMSILGATLTLPGLAGIALTVGLSVDANVLINERIREELRAGNTPLNSISTGYEKATGTIADANITAMLAGIALLVFGTGPVKGFAITLILGILTSMYTAVSFSRGVAALIYSGRKKLKTLWI